MEVIHRRCSGLDVHKETVVACVRLVLDGKITREVRRFETTTSGLLLLLAWLTEMGCTHVAMEATGVYWKPVWNILSDGDFELVLANAAHIKNVPGRKTDVSDAAWIADLLAHGLIRSSFVPEQEIQELRELLRTRKQLGRQQSSHIKRLQKTLESANVKLDSVITDIVGKSGRAMIQALMAGETDPGKLAALADHRIKASAQEIARGPPWSGDQSSSFPAAPSPAAHRVRGRSDPGHRSQRYCSHHPDGSGGGGRSNPGQLSKPDFASDDDPRHRCVISADHPVGDRPRHEPVPDCGTSLVLGWVVSTQR